MAIAMQHKFRGLVIQNATVGGRRSIASGQIYCIWANSLALGYIDTASETSALALGV